MTEMLEKGCVIGIILAVIVRSRTRHGEINKLEALAVFGLLDFALGTFDNANDGFDMGIES